MVLLPADKALHQAGLLINQLVVRSFLFISDHSKDFQIQMRIGNLLKDRAPAVIIEYISPRDPALSVCLAGMSRLFTRMIDGGAGSKTLGAPHHRFI